MYYRLSINYGMYSWFLALYALPCAIILMSLPVVVWRRRRGARRLRVTDRRDGPPRSRPRRSPQASSRPQ